jgi:hypothetical protein
MVMVTGAALTLHRAPARQGCRWGALDEWRALQGLDAAGWRTAWAQADLPQRLSAAAMLPMMAGLPAMLALCTPAGTSPPWLAPSRRSDSSPTTAGKARASTAPGSMPKVTVEVTSTGANSAASRATKSRASSAIKCVWVFVS